MSNVVDFAQAKLERTPHITGPARCLACKHEWVAVAPEGTLWLDCPSCGLSKGRFVYPVAPPGEVWECACGNKLHYAMADGLFCPSCGVLIPYTEIK